MHGGIYIAVFHLGRARDITVGSLGRHRFPAGLFLYVGSAQRNLDGRLARHARKTKPLRWHIDHLSAKAKMLGAIVVPGPKSLECRLADRLAKLYRRHVPRFGASDCRCGGHLFYSGKF